MKKRTKERAATIVKVICGTLPPVDEDDCTFEDDNDDNAVWREPIGYGIPQGVSWNPPPPTRRS